MGFCIDSGEHSWDMRGKCGTCDIQAGSMVNLTPHDLNVLLDGTTKMIPRTGIIARVTEKAGEPIPFPALIWTGPGQAKRARLTATRVAYGDVEGLPGERLVHHLSYDSADAITPEHYYIVSAVTAMHPALSVRRDICYPGAAVRDDAGRQTGITGLYFLDR